MFDPMNPITYDAPTGEIVVVPNPPTAQTEWFDVFVRGKRLGYFYKDATTGYWHTGTLGSGDCWEMGTYLERKYAEEALISAVRP